MSKDKMVELKKNLSKEELEFLRQYILQYEAFHKQIKGEQVGSHNSRR